ncbi:SURF1 family protein [Kiloniella sp.]|uniref:SURF1 family protein n=1 Tax=Kiloniella sp. TaxID=1938587 RepID=UPI003A91E881
MTKGTLRRFQPTFWPTMFTIPVVLIAIALGTWQLSRMEWKKDQIALRTDRASAVAISFSETYPGEVADPQADEFINVWVEGEFLHDKELIMGARSLDRQLGIQIITPFVMTDGRQILINRGFVPSEFKAPASRPEGQVDGPVKIEGLLRVGGWKGYEFVRPVNDPEDNFWFYTDIKEMSQKTDLSNPVMSVYLDAGPAANPGGYPLGGQTRIALVNNHLEYVITWYAMALILAVIYFIYHYRPVEKREDD